MKLTGKSILITGASTGIGKAFALRCAKDKCHIFLVARNIEKLEDVKREIESIGSTASVIPTDVSDSLQVKKLFDVVKSESDSLDLVFDNAGLGHIANIFDQSDENICSMVDVNVKGMFLVAKYASVILKEQGYGHLILTSSLAGLVSVPKWSTYVGTKWAVTGFAESIRMELEPFGVLVSSLHPGFVKTEFFGDGKAQMNEEELEKGGAITVDKVVDALYHAVFTKNSMITVPNIVKIYSLLYRLFPSLAKRIAKSKV